MNTLAGLFSAEERRRRKREEDFKAKWSVWAIAASYGTYLVALYWLAHPLGALSCAILTVTVLVPPGFRFAYVTLVIALASGDAWTGILVALIAAAAQSISGAAAMAVLHVFDRHLDAKCV